MNQEHKVVVINHNDTQYLKKYWTDTREKAMEIAASEAYPFGIKSITWFQRWAHPDFEGSHITLTAEFLG